MMNPLWTLSGLLEHAPVSDLIEGCDNSTKVRFEDWCVGNAKGDEDLCNVREQAAEAYDWWNMLPHHGITLDSER